MALPSQRSRTHVFVRDLEQPVVSRVAVQARRPRTLAHSDHTACPFSISIGALQMHEIGECRCQSSEHPGFDSH